MKNVLFTLVTSLFTASMVLAQSNAGVSSGSSDPKLEQEFTQLYRKWDNALVKVDLNTLDSLFAVEYELISVDGAMLSKTELLAELKSKKDVVSSASTDQLKVTQYGDTAIVTTRWTAQEVYDGKDASGQSRWTDVWMKRDGRWQVFATHGSNITDPEAEAKEKITRLYRDWDQAMLHVDLKALDRIMHQDYVSTDDDGHVSSKAKVLAATKSGEDVVSATQTDELKIRVYRDTAVVTGRWTASGKNKGKAWSGVFPFTDTWVRRNGTWQVVGDHWSKSEAK